MSDDNVERLRPTGAIAGFTDIDLTGDGTPQGLNPAIFSLSQAIARLGTLVNAINPNMVTAVEDDVLRHIQDHDNPHQDSLSSLVTDLGSEILATYMPGTAPLSKPSASIEPGLLVYDDRLLGVSRSSVITTVDPHGYLMTTTANTLAYDYSSGVPEVVMWPATDQLLSVINTKTTTEAAAVGGSLDTSTISGLISPLKDTNYVNVWENSSDVAHGYGITKAVTAGTEYVFSTHLMMAPGITTGYIAIRVDQVPAEVLYLNVATGKFVNSTDNLIGHVIKSASGWYRIGIQFVAVSSATCSAQFLYTTTIGDLTYPGTPNRHIFSTAIINLTTGPGMAPVMLSGQTSLAATTLTYDLSNTIDLRKGCLALTYTTSRSLIARDYPVFNIDTAAIIRHKGLSVQCTLNTGTPAVVTSYPIRDDQEVIFSASYSPTQTVSKNTGTNRVIVNGSFPGFYSAATFTIGGYPGTFGGFTAYSTADDGQVLEYLVGERVL